MKAIRSATLLAASMCVFTSQAQSDKTKDFRTDNEKGLIETIAKIEKKTDKFNLNLGMHGDFDLDWTGNDFKGGHFQFKQLRVEAKGRLTDWLTYRYRQRLTKDDHVAATDNVFGSIDIAQIGLNFGKWDFAFGKMCAAYGGIEFDLNPIEIYQYSDMVDYMSNFMTGVNVAYNFNSNHQLQLQILNALTGTSAEMYGSGYTKAKLPLVYTLNWNGNVADVWKPRWSASLMNETKGEHMYYFALGNDFKLSDKVGAYFDWMYSIEGVDRKGIISTIVGADQGFRHVKDVEYMSFILHLNYRFHPAWNIFAKGMYEREGVRKSSEAYVDPSTTVQVESGLYRQALGYIGGVEYYPFKDRNLHFFATYVGRNYLYTKRAEAFGAEHYNTNNISVGFIWNMPVF